MNIPDPRHAAATAPVATPPAPQWGGEGPAVIDPGLIAHLANAFFNGSPGQAVDPQALANHILTPERPPSPPTSLPGAIGAGASAPATSIPGAQTVPFVTELPGSATSAARAPAEHIPAAGLATGAPGLPAGAAGTPAPGVAGALPEASLNAPRGFLSEAQLASLPQTLGALTSLAPTTHPSGFSALPRSREGLYFLDQAIPSAGAAPMAAPTAFSPVPSAPLSGLVSSLAGDAPGGTYGSPAFAPEQGPAFEQSPAFGDSFPSERDLRPQRHAETHTLDSRSGDPGFSPKTHSIGHPQIPGETLYFLNDAQAASKPGAPAPAQERPLPEPQAPAQSELIAGVRAFDAHAIKRDFPILAQQVHGKPLIWLDNAATTQKPQAVIDRLALFYETENSNIHRAAHTLAARSTDAYEAAREKVRRFVGAGSSNEIVFARGATEAINLVAKAWGRRNVREGDEIVVTWLEHHANIVPWQMLCAEVGAVLRVAPVDDSGQILLDEYTKLLGPRTRLVSLPQVSNALGTVTPAQEMVAIAHRHGACVLIDGAQAVSHMPINVQALDCDFYVFSGHKVFGPTGIGVLYGKPDVLAATPPWQGGGNMIADVTFEKTIYQPPPGRFEAGTGNIADAVGLGAAIDYLDRIGMSNIAAYEHELLGYMTQGLLGVPGLKIIGSAKEKAGVVSFILDGCRSEDVGAALDREGIAVRAGHHCAQPILRRFGLETTVRPSLALYNTYEDIDALVAALHRIQAQKNARPR